jgi:hypothetical protein
LSERCQFEISLDNESALRLAPIGMPLAESLGQTTEGQLWLTSKPADICSAYTPAKEAFLLMNDLPLLFLGLPVMPLFLPVSLVTMWMKSWEERCTHIREAGATKIFLFQINLALS